MARNRHHSNQQRITSLSASYYTYRCAERMSPENPEARNLRREQGKLLLHRVDNDARAPVASKERRGILALDRILRVAGQGMGEETAMNVEQCCAKKIIRLAHILPQSAEQEVEKTYSVHGNSLA